MTEMCVCKHDDADHNENGCMECGACEEYRPVARTCRLPETDTE